MSLSHNLNEKEGGEELWAICPSQPRAEPELIYLEQHTACKAWYTFPVLQKQLINGTLKSRIPERLNFYAIQ